MNVEEDEVNEDNMQQRSDVSDFKDPSKGWPRPTGLCKGCWLYQFKRGLARAWTLPPHIRGGTIAVRLNDLDIGVQFGEVMEGLPLRVVHDGQDQADGSDPKS